jgi:serine/threonine protein kinase/dienelactone hydrolase
MSASLQQQLQDSLGPEFLLQRELGAGGMSRVFLAEERSLGRRVVVKVLSPDLAASISAERFDREIRLAAQLQDPRIVPLLRAGTLGDLPFYTMPYVEGESLRARLDQAPVPLEDALGILRDLALALEYAHARNVVHRDIKPENILLSGRTAVVTDFGIAKAITAATHAASGATLAMQGTVVGTPAYMAPEQAVGEAVDTRADLYAWGVIAYEMLGGAHPFASHTSSAQAVVAAHIAETPVPLGERRPDLPPPLTTLVDRCLAKAPAQRPADASTLVTALNEALRPRETKRSRSTPLRVAIALAAVVALAASAVGLYLRFEHRRWAREEAIPGSNKLRDAGRELAALFTLQRAARYLPGDPAIKAATDSLTLAISVMSSPSGASVEIQDYLSPDTAWYRLGPTPLSTVTVPDGYFRWRVSKPGLGEYIVAPLLRLKMRFALDTALNAPKGMVWIGAGRWGNMIDFVGWVGPYNLPAFYMDRFEVTNRQYQEFVDKGGYAKREYWTEKFVEHGRELTWDQAMPRFRDRTGRAGPSTWDGGHYPDGEADHPVSGISWFEASAYTTFAGNSLPTFAQWYEAAPPGLGDRIARESNISRTQVAAAGTFKGIGPYGTYDMAGNVREWVANALDEDRRFILGGAWNSPSYLYADPEALSPFDRSPTNGVRTVRNITPLPPEVSRPVKPLDRDFSKVRPASDEVFRAYRVMYDYPRTPLNAKTDSIAGETKDWRVERVSFDAPYGSGRLTAYLFLPKRVRPRYQTVVFFPSARVLDIPSSADLGDVEFFDYVVQSGRAVLYPIYQDTYERRFTQRMPSATQPIDIIVQRAKEVGRSLDYLASRADIDKNNLAYLGVSMGSAEGVIYTTLAQDRLKTAVFLDGGFFLGKPRDGEDQADFAPRLKRPVLMVNGRYDFTFSLERAQNPLFNMLGTPAADKQHIVLETSHDVRTKRSELLSSVLGWLDKYLGRVQ